MFSYSVAESEAGLAWRAGVNRCSGPLLVVLVIIHSHEAFFFKMQKIDTLCIEIISNVLTFIIDLLHGNTMIHWKVCDKSSTVRSTDVTDEDSEIWVDEGYADKICYNIIFTYATNILIVQVRSKVSELFTKQILENYNRKGESTRAGSGQTLTYS